MSEPKIAKAGKLLCLDSGNYSDYIVHGFFVVLRDFDPLAELALHLDLNKEQAKPYLFEQESYIATLLAKGLLMEVSYGTLFLGEYSSHEVTLMPAADDTPKHEASK